MTLETLAFVLLALGILGAHLATLRLLVDCKRDLSVSATNFNGSLSGVGESMNEMIRIGSDVADQIDNLSFGSGVVSSPSVSPPVDLQTTIMSLIANQFLGSNHGDTTQQERTIQQENDTTPESISDD